MNYDKFMGDDSERAIIKLKINNLLTTIHDSIIHCVTSYDIRLKLLHDYHSINYISIFHSRYTYEYLKSKYSEICDYCGQPVSITIHDGLILDGYIIDNVIMTYRPKNLIEKLIVGGIL